jgi:hypothetical protein
MSKENPDKALLEKLVKRRPTVLLLGQSYLGDSTKTNSFLRSVAEHFKLDESGAETILDQLIERLESRDASASLQYLHRRSETVPIAENLYDVSEFAWSNVFTSAIDEVWVRAFKKPWRSLRAVFTESAWPLEIRDHNALCSTFLFGCVDKEDEDCRIPKGLFNFDEKTQRAVALLRRLPEITTPLGVVLIEGYNPKTDWLKAKDLYPVLNSLGSKQAFLFSASDEICRDKYLAKLCEDGKLMFLPGKLAAFLRHAEQEGSITFGDPAIKLPAGRQITIDSAPQVIPKDLWQNLTGIAAILDDNSVMPTKPLSADQGYMDYRNFLADPIRPNDWTGFARGYVFRRDFEKLLHNECEKRLKQSRLQLNPLLLHGESGTGKTVAMANTAYQIASECVFPTVFIDRSVSSPDWRPIDRFLNWAEDCGAPACLVVWDGMRDPDQYLNLQRRLADRGRKVLVLGSTYLNNAPGTNHVEAPRELNLTEKSAFGSYLTQFLPDFAEALKKTDITIDSSFLVALYRILPTTRPRLARGITGELEYAGKDILDKIKAAESKKTEFNSLAVAFQQIPFLQSDARASSGDEAIGESNIRDEVQELIALVMVPGKYGFKVPIELLLSALGRNINSTTISALQTGVLMWSEQQSGDILVGPRHPLEAKMYLDGLYGGAAEAEAEFICKLLLGLKKGASGESHIDFVIDLLKHVGPNSPIERNRTQFQRCILTFAEALTRLRKEKSVLSPRLMLQEGTFYREAVRLTESMRPPDERYKLLERAEEVLVSAKGQGNCPEALKSSLNAELAACYGSMIRTLEDEMNGKMEVVALYSKARDALKEAVRRNWANAHAVVTLGWISRGMLDSTVLSEAEKSEIQAELLFRFDEAVPTSFDSIQLDYFLKEKLRVMECLGRQEMAEQTFEALKRTGSKAGYFLKARSLFAAFPDSKPSPADLESMKRAEAYLQENWEEIAADERCLGLYLNLWWFIRVEGPRFGKERQVLPFSDAEWRMLTEVTETLKTLKEPDPPAWLRFLSALSLFHCGEVSRSIQEFRSMSSDPNLQAGGHRLKKYFVASENGSVVTYEGTVRARVEENRMGEIWVNQIRQAIPIVPRDFDKRELRQGEPISDFNIAFSYTGPIAQPPHFMRGRSSFA